MNTNKMYILIRDDVDLGHALLAAAHAALSGYLTFVDFEHSPEYRMFFGAAKDPSDTELWATESFRKVICKVTPAEFEKAKTYGKNMQDYRIMTESGLNNMEVAIVFRPVESDKLPKFLKLYRSLTDGQNKPVGEGCGKEDGYVSSTPGGPTKNIDIDFCRCIVHTLSDLNREAWSSGLSSGPQGSRRFKSYRFRH